MINNDQPQFLGVSEILQNSTNHTLNLLERELKINLEELQKKCKYFAIRKDLY